MTTTGMETVSKKMKVIDDDNRNRGIIRKASTLESNRARLEAAEILMSKTTQEIAILERWFKSETDPDTKKDSCRK